MNSYPINRWDVVMFGNSTTRVPMIYIKPDIAFKEFIKKNSYAVMCEISGTDTVYDNKQIPGVADTSCVIPNCRPNFCEATGLYVITLWSNWYGYPSPDKPGFVKFIGMKDSDENVASGVMQFKKKHKKHKKSETKKSMNMRMIVLVLAILCILFLVIASFRKKNVYE